MKTICSELRGEYQYLLSGSLTQDRESKLTAHLDDCESCQYWLESSQGNHDEWQQAADILRLGGQVATSPELGRTAIADSSPMQDQSQSETRLRGLENRYLAILAPSDDPRSLGRIGGLEVVGLLGHGGAGVVYKALDTALGRYVAVKVIDPTCQNPEAARTRFAREARAMAAISHEHVVPVYGVSEHKGLPYFVMEYVTGGTLARRLECDGPLGVIETVRVGIQIARGLAAAHRQGVVHRDVKPSNILLDPGVERVRVADFGLARAATDHTQTETGTLLGTPHYMSPEQVRCDEIDGRSDLFSLGSVLYVACTGKTPFNADTVYSLMQKIANDEPLPPSHGNGEIPNWLDALVMRLLSKNPDCRFADANELADVLERELAHLQQPETTPAPSRDWMPPVQRVWFPKRYLTAALVTCAVLIGAAMWTAQVNHWFAGLVRQEVPTNQPEKQLPLAAELQPWADEILAQTTHNPVAFDIVPRMIKELRPDDSLQVANAVWPAIGVPDVKTGILKAFYFQQHPQVVKGLNLGAEDNDPTVRDYAMSYIQQIALRPFDLNPNGYKKWFEANKDASLKDIFASGYQSLADKIRGSDYQVGSTVLREFGVDFGSYRTKTSYPEEIAAVQATDLGDTILGWFLNPDGLARDDDMIARFPFTEEQIDSKIVPRLDDELPIRTITNLAIAADRKELARELLLRAVADAIKPEANYDDKKLILFQACFGLADLGDPQSIAPMIDLMTQTDNRRAQQQINSALCRKSLGEFTKVAYNEFAGPAWWHQWWNENHDGLPESAKTMQLQSKLTEDHSGSHPDFETHDGRMAIFQQEYENFVAGRNNNLTSAARSFSKAGDPRAIPLMIAAIEADNSYDTVYMVGYFGMGFDEMRLVDYSQFHDGAWWHRWWNENKSKFGEEVASMEIPVLPKTEHGKNYTPFPDDLDMHEGRVAFLEQQLESGDVELTMLADLFSENDDPRGIPVLIGLIDAWPNQKAIYDVGYFGLGQGALGKLTKVKYDESHDATWWKAWWLTHRDEFPLAANCDIPKFEITENVLERKIQPSPTSELKTVKGNDRQKYFLIGDPENPPNDGFNLLLVMPGGDGGRDFLPFIENVSKNVLDESWLVAELISVKWNKDQQIVWPKNSDTVKGLEFTTAQFVESVIADVKSQSKINPKNIITLSWSSSGPAAYAIATSPNKSVTASFIAMSVFRPQFCDPAYQVKDHRFFIAHSPEDQICPWEQSRLAIRTMMKHGGKVTEAKYEGGHGWHPELFQQLGTGLRSLLDQ